MFVQLAWIIAIFGIQNQQKATNRSEILKLMLSKINLETI